MILVSTGGYKTQPAWKTCHSFLSAGILNIELSGGSYDADQLTHLRSIKKSTTLQIHNYFPPPEKPFVFNLASLVDETADRSLEHAKRAILWSSELGRLVYSFHAGFLVELTVNELGKTMISRDLFDRDKAMCYFLERVCYLADYARAHGVEILIENNVVSAINLKQFNANPCLMADSGECLFVMRRTPKNVNLLIDVAHLKVSARSLGFEKVLFLENCNPWIKAYHLSDNDGTQDANEIVTKDSWFWPHIKRELKYYSLEIYNVPLRTLSQQLSLAEAMLSGKD